jgi:hypothetical protein
MPGPASRSSRRCFALVPCAGVGERAPHTLAALAAVPALDAVLVVLAGDDQMFERQAPAFYGGRAWVARCGGATRAASVTNGLAELRRRGASDDDWVLVHDAARCLLQARVGRPALIDACIDDAVGGLLALPLADTLKRPDRRPRRRHAVPRDGSGWRRRRRCSAWACCSERWRTLAGTRPSPTRPAPSRRWAWRRAREPAMPRT